MNKIAIYKQALEDWKILTNKFNGLEDKSIENIKRTFVDQIECNQIFFIIKQGIVKVYLQTDNHGICNLKEPFTIETNKYIKAFISVSDIEKEISYI